MEVTSRTVKTTPFSDQKPGTSGLRKKTKHFMQENYVNNFIQSIINVVVDKKDFSLVVGGDGRFYNKDVILKHIIPISVSNGISKLIIGRNGILSTPAVSHVIRKYSADGGILLTASHNPGGIDEDFGIKYNIKNGGPAPENVTNRIYDTSKLIESFKTSDAVSIDLSVVQDTEVRDRGTGHKMQVRVVDSVTDYAAYMEQLFDFPAIRAMIKGEDGLPALRVLANSLSGVMGVYVTNIFCDRLGMPAQNAENCVILEDFGGRHPDPNLTYARDLVEKMETGQFDLGCAFDGDGDRNMVLGKDGFFVTPCDSLAVVADNAHTIPYFQSHGVHGFARSMPTSSAVDKVGAKKNLAVYEVPTGWKFFGNLMDAGKLSLCGEESFGMGSDHIREKDGMWAVLAWLSILASHRKTAGKMVSVREVMEHHWQIYGRNFFTRYDYENCSIEQGDKLMSVLSGFIADPKSIGRSFEEHGQKFVVKLTDNFEYVDPIDQSVSKNQGIRVIFADGSRLVYRLSGTGSSGATVRIYIDSYQKDPATYGQSSEVVLKPLVDIGLQIGQIKAITGREQPTVIT